MFDTDVAALDPDSTLSLGVELRAVSDRAEAKLLEIATHWADLHTCVEETQAALPGCEQLVLLGGVGTPEVAEFAPAELGAVLAMSPHSAARLIGDALDLRHRLPRLWARVLAGEVKPWIGRQTAETTRTLSKETAAQVDRRVTPWAHSLSWGRLEAIIEAVVIEADPEAAALAVQQAEQAQGVWLRPSNDHGIKDIYIRTEAPAATAAPADESDHTGKPDRNLVGTASPARPVMAEESGWPVERSNLAGLEQPEGPESRKI